jgi:hypothetical protein
MLGAYTRGQPPYRLYPHVAQNRGTKILGNAEKWQLPRPQCDALFEAQTRGFGTETGDDDPLAAGCPSRGLGEIADGRSRTGVAGMIRGSTPEPRNRTSRKPQSWSRQRRMRGKRPLGRKRSSGVFITPLLPLAAQLRTRRRPAHRRPGTALWCRFNCRHAPALAAFQFEPAQKALWCMRVNIWLVGCIGLEDRAV